MPKDDNERIITRIVREGETPYLWEELSETDKENIRRFIQRRERQGTDDEDLRHELKVLVGLAYKETNGPLSATSLNEFDEPTNRPNRTLAHFLVFTGAEAPRCPKCGEQNYVPSEDDPMEMRCSGCTFTFSDQELTHYI